MKPFQVRHQPNATEVLLDVIPEYRTYGAKTQNSLLDLVEVDAIVLNHDLLSEVALISNEEGMVLILSSFH